MHTIKGFIHVIPGFLPGDPPRFAWWQWQDMSSAGWTLVMPYDLTFEVPSDFNPVAVEVTMLETERSRVSSECQDRLLKINKRLAELQCIEFDAGDAS